MPGSCTCTSCYDNVGGPHCETCAEGYTGDAPWCFLDCVASANPSDDGSLESDGNFFCINGGTVGGIAGQCTCTSCYDNIVGPHCETCAEGYIGDAPWCFLNCQTSDIHTDDGSLEKSGRFYCINGGTIGGIAGQCTCTQCDAGFDGSHCENLFQCQNTTNPFDNGSLENGGNFYCINGGTIGGSAGSCTCTCSPGFEGFHCETPSLCKATLNPPDVGGDGNFYCTNGGTIGGTTGNCTCTQCNPGFAGIHCNETASMEINTNEDKSGSNATLFAGLAAAVLVIAIFFSYFYFNKHPAVSKEGIPSAISKLSVVVPQEGLLSDSQYDKIAIAKIANKMKNQVQTYTPEEEKQIEKGIELHLRCKEIETKAKIIKSPDERVDMKLFYPEGEVVATLVASTTLDTTAEEGAAWAIVHLDSRTRLRQAKIKGVTHLKVEHVNPHTLYYVTSRNMGIPGMHARDTRNILTWKKQKDGRMIISNLNSEAMEKKYPVKKGNVLIEAQTSYVYEPTDAMGDVPQTKLTFTSKIDMKVRRGRNLECGGESAEGFTWESHNDTVFHTN
jgi:hypothetical protein